MLSMPASVVCCFAFMLRPRALASAAALALLTALVAPSAHAFATRAAIRSAATVTLTQVTVKDTADDAKITIGGRVRLPANTARERKRALVHLTLTGFTGTTLTTEPFTAKLTSKDLFTVVHTTKLTGALGLDAVVEIGGRRSGKKVVKTVNVAVLTTGAKSVTGGGATSSGPAGDSNTSAAQGTPLVGTFDIQAGAQAQSGAITGSYFQMLLAPSYTQALNNPNSTALDDTYTLLSPGIDGGLSTAAYQPAPDPAFGYASDSPDPEAGNSLADGIIQPLGFYNVNFSIATQQSDLQDVYLGVAPPENDPLPSIIDTDGALSGQVTAWSAGWNNAWFNQGSPKPNGAYPTGTTPVSGTFDAVTGQYTLTWDSLIVGGQFNNFVGAWHLAGTFVPSP
jgi:hypothetical protein